MAVEARMAVDARVRRESAGEPEPSGIFRAPDRSDRVGGLVAFALRMGYFPSVSAIVTPAAIREKL